MRRQNEEGEAVCDEPGGHERGEHGARLGPLDRAQRRLRAAEGPGVRLEPRAADGDARDREDQAVREHANPGERRRPSFLLASHDRRGEIRWEPAEERPRHLDAARDDGDRATELEGAASQRRRDEVRPQLAQTRGVPARPEMKEDANGGDCKKQVRQRARDVSDLNEAPARAHALRDTKEHEGEQPGRHDRKGEPPVPARERPGKRVRGPVRAATLEERHPRRDPSHEDVNDPAREEAEPRERLGDALFRSPRDQRHARHLRRRGLVVSTVLKRCVLGDNFRFAGRAFVRKVEG